MSNAISICNSRASVFSSDQEIIEEEKKERDLNFNALPHEVELSGQINSPHSSDKQMKIPYSDAFSQSNSHLSSQNASLAEGSSKGPNKLLDKKLYDNSPRLNLINVIESSIGEMPLWIECDITEQTDECMEINSAVPKKKV